MQQLKHGFLPVFDGRSRLLVLGSFPSVQSRRTEFYYGNPRNRFWRVLCGFFGRVPPADTEGKRRFLLENGVALWDVVAECEIIASYDSTIKNHRVADIGSILQSAPIELIILNGGTALKIFERNFSDCPVPHVGLPSTSPANTHFDESLWREALARVFTGAADSDE